MSMVVDHFVNSHFFPFKKSFSKGVKDQNQRMGANGIGSDNIDLLVSIPWLVDTVIDS